MLFRSPRRCALPAASVEAAWYCLVRRQTLYLGFQPAQPRPPALLAITLALLPKVSAATPPLSTPSPRPSAETGSAPAFRSAHARDLRTVPGRQSALRMRGASAPYPAGTCARFLPRGHTGRGSRPLGLSFTVQFTFNTDTRYLQCLIFSVRFSLTGTPNELPFSK